ncbi:deoxyribodipyrimidine photo-lyase [Dyadobacter fermentans]|uniref:Deoxyribodipyrimidine photo-lyase n=1 Tax=Dyadobacter fermentans (strain ATCC 700827 / DSM 18053 / CIP 107007 / KCTC 52180 / NS114) TaxID=471854 RepID=C6W1W4_DYAFD|nr:deoxyribodipyrimidine photo-lyase [Dyadobacter fermentans]ACT95539.1 Deoxyribodipyrimidine photo-lyase [Dyadobacter fermentans DSM 18053]
MARRIIYWFRNDLRLKDNQALSAAVGSADEIIPVYVFDPRQFEKTKLGFRRTGALRARFLIESVAELRENIRQKGGDLIIRTGAPEAIVAQLAEDYNADYVYTSKEIAPQETRIESSLSKNLKTANVDIKLFWMDTMINATDLPFPVSKLPSGFAEFERLLSNDLKIKDQFPTPASITLPADVEAGAIPGLPELGIDPNEIPAGTTGPLAGGEARALAVLKEYVEEYVKKDIAYPSAEPLTDTRLSDWLSLGCVSASYIYRSVKTAQSHAVVEDPIITNLLRREFLHWTLLRFGPRMFKPSGVKHHFNRRWKNDNAAFEKWINGQTGDQSINDIIRRLTATGFITAAERESAARYLVDDLDINWTWGAMYFESLLMDYEASVNWGRWNHIAGVGED